MKADQDLHSLDIISSSGTIVLQKKKRKKKKKENIQAIALFNHSLLVFKATFDHLDMLTAPGSRKLPGHSFIKFIENVYGYVSNGNDGCQHPFIAVYIEFCFLWAFTELLRPDGRCS